jgi:hypothetical protein
LLQGTAVAFILINNNLSKTFCFDFERKRKMGKMKQEKTKAEYLAQSILRRNIMANTFGQSKVDDSAWGNNKELNPQENSSVTNDATQDNDGMSDSAWRPTDSTLESPTNSEFDDSEAKKRDQNIESESPGINPGVGK